MKHVRTQRALQTLAGLLGAMALVTALAAQTHKVAKPENVVRAVGVYEWTGDMANPAASRLIPVSLFIDNKFESAAVYMARPVPFALLTGNVYQLEKAGTLVGTLNLAFAKHLVAAADATTSYDDGWFGYGKFFPPSAIKKPTALKPVAKLTKINGIDDDDDKPHFSSRSAAPGTGGSAEPKPGSTPASTTPGDDPDRPTMRRHSSGSDTASNSPGPNSTPADDADRPTLKKRSASDDSKSSSRDNNSVSAVPNSLNDDPNRPMLHRGKPTSAMTEEDLPKLSGLPVDQDLHQMVAVSDAADRPPHDFVRAWEGESEHQAILGKLQTAARAQLAAYEAANGAAPPAPPAVSAPDTRRPGSKARRSTVKEAPPAAPPVEELKDEQLTGYTLSYGGQPTYVYYAHTDGLGGSLRYVTLVAQVDAQGEPQIAIKNVTDATHLDRTPRMRLVDAVDAEASNRASLLFELRAQHSRQFALYRVIGARADQIFVTGSTQ
jgi:hypothetical protein